MPTDEEIESKIHDAVIKETIKKKKKIEISIEDLGIAFITKKIFESLPKKVLPNGTKLCVKISRFEDGRWLVSKIISINGESYLSSEGQSKRMKDKNEPKTEFNSKKKDSKKFPDLDQKYVFNWATGKSRRKIPNSYGLNLCSEGFLRNWQENSFVKLIDYSHVLEIIPNHPESKFTGKIVAFNFVKGWQGFIFCESINSLVYIKHNLSRLSGSIDLGAKVEFFLGTNFDNRKQLQFVARDWESNVNRGNAPEPAITLEFEEFQQSRTLVETLLSETEQFLMITSFNVSGKQVYKTDDIVNYLNREYSKYPYQVLEWPNQSITGRFTHPLIANYVSVAIVLFPQNDGGEEE